MTRANSFPSSLTPNLRERFFHPNLLQDQEYKWAMDQILTKLGKKRTKGVNFKVLLFILRKAKLQEKRAARKKDTFSHIIRSEWDKERKKVHKHLDHLVHTLLALYQVVDDHPSLRRAIYPNLKNNKYLIEGDDVLNHLLKLDDAIQRSPLLQLSRPPGHQPQLWLKDAETRLKEVHIPKQETDKLLRLIGLKPYPDF